MDLTSFSKPDDQGRGHIHLSIHGSIYIAVSAQNNWRFPRVSPVKEREGKHPSYPHGELLIDTAPGLREFDGGDTGRSGLQIEEKGTEEKK